MSKVKRQIVGKIGYCDNTILGLKDKHGNIIDGGHYVYIRKYNQKTGTCDVNIITSLENENKYFIIDKLKKVKGGFLYPIPKRDANFSLWSAINLDGNINGVALSNIIDIGKKSIKQRHKFFVGKFTQKHTKKVKRKFFN